MRKTISAVLIACAGMMLIPSLWGCAIVHFPRERKVKSLTERLASGDTPDAMAALDELAKVKGESATEAITLGLDHQRPGIREHSVEILGQRRDPTAVPALACALKDTHATIRKKAADALAEIGNRGAIEALIDDLRQHASMALMPSAFEDYDAGSGNWTVDALVRIGSPATSLLTAALQDNDAAVRAAAAETLGKIGDAGFVENLIPLPVSYTHLRAHET